MRSSDWSSDVCSADLGDLADRDWGSPARRRDSIADLIDRAHAGIDAHKVRFATTVVVIGAHREICVFESLAEFAVRDAETGEFRRVWFDHKRQIGRASCRESVCQSV